MQRVCFGGENGPTFHGDELWEQCFWKVESDLEGLRGKHSEIELRLTSGKNFACRFAPAAGQVCKARPYGNTCRKEAKPFRWMHRRP